MGFKNNSPCRPASTIFQYIVGGEGNTFFIFIFKQAPHFSVSALMREIHAGKYERENEVDQGEKKWGKNLDYI